MREGTNRLDAKSLKMLELAASWDTAKERLCMSFINRKWHEKELDKLAYRSFLDLAVVYHVRLGKTEEGQTMMVKVTDQLLKVWGIAEDTLYEAATEAMKKNDPALAKSLKEMIGLPGGEADDGSCPLTVLTTESTVLGAAALLYSGIVEKMAKEQKSDILVLPSSVHEVLLLPYEEKPGTVMDLLELVHSVNASTVSEPDRLSDNIYHYHWQEDQYSLICREECCA